MKEEEGYIYRPEMGMGMRKIKIPEGMVKCPTCKGSGEMRLYYGGPGDRGQFGDCITCGGRGFAEKEWIEELRKTRRLKETKE
jgi:DnaJ-class molecular chaperone